MRQICLYMWGLVLLAAGGVSAGQAAEDQKLWVAAKLGDVETVRSLLDSGVEVDAKTDYGATALAFAAERGHLEVVALLIQRGADVNNKDRFYGFTPRTWAQYGKHQEIVDLLDKHGGKLSLGMRATQTQKRASTDAEATGSASAESHTDSVTKLTTETESSPSQFTFPHWDEKRLMEDDLSVSSSNWPQFRGSGARGVADGQHPPVNWDGSPDGKRPLAWKTPIPGLGNSSPVIWGNRLFVTTAVSGAENEELKIGYYGSVDSVEDASEHQFIVYCLDKTTGEVLWKQVAITTVPAVKRHLKSTHADPTIATDGTHVVAFFGSEGLYCYNIDGALLWQKSLGLLDSGWFYDPDYQWEFGSSPIIYRDWVILQCDVQTDSFVAAFDVRSGNEVWRTQRDEVPGWATPTAYESPAGPLLFTNGTRQMRCYYLDSGELAWSYEGNSEITAPTPFVAYDTVFLTAGYSPIQPIRAITLGARGDLTLEDGQVQSEFVRWSTRKGGPYLPTPVAYRGHLYICSNQGVLACYDAQSGERLYRNRFETPGQRSFVASPVAADGRLYFTAEDGHVLVVAAGPEFQQLATNVIGESVLSTPAISEEAIYFRTQHHVMSFRESN